jgi:hypothetical protein
LEVVGLLNLIALLLRSSDPGSAVSYQVNTQALTLQVAQGVAIQILGMAWHGRLLDQNPWIFCDGWVYPHLFPLDCPKCWIYLGEIRQHSLIIHPANLRIIIGVVSSIRLSGDDLPLEMEGQHRT